MATPSKQPKLTYEPLAEQSKEKEMNDLKNQLEKQKVENQELLNGILDLKNQVAFQKDQLHEKDEALKVKEEYIAELKSLFSTEEYLNKQLANQRDKIQEQYDVLRYPLDHLPDEVQLSIFKFLDFGDVIRCAQVSKRARRICHDESIWKKVNLYGKTVPSGFIEQILENGCQYINLYCSKIVGDLKLSRNDYDVKYLNISWCRADKGVLEKLISSCPTLQKLSMANLDPMGQGMDGGNVGINVLKSLNPQQLHTLDLNHFKGLDIELMKGLLSSKTLTEISFFNNCYLSNECVQYLVENLPSDLEKISLSGIHCLTDEHIKTLVKRCKKIKELELAGNTNFTDNSLTSNITEESLTSIAEHSDQMVKLDVQGANIGLGIVEGRNPFLKLQSLPKLKVLHCQHEKRSAQGVGNLTKLLPHLEINREHFGWHLEIASPGFPFSIRPKRGSNRPKNGLWDIVVKTINLFPEKKVSQKKVKRQKLQKYRSKFG